MCVILSPENRFKTINSHFPSNHRPPKPTEFPFFSRDGWRGKIVFDDLCDRRGISFFHNNCDEVG